MADLSETVHRLLSLCHPTSPQLLFECYYRQTCTELANDTIPNICLVGGPKGMIGHLRDFQACVSHFGWLYPEAEFLKGPSVAHLAAEIAEGNDDERFEALEDVMSKSEHV